MARIPGLETSGYGGYLSATLDSAYEIDFKDDSPPLDLMSVIEDNAPGTISGDIDDVLDELEPSPEDINALAKIERAVKASNSPPGKNPPLRSALKLKEQKH